jgi:osmotically-inducible protein OsmY
VVTIVPGTCAKTFRVDAAQEFVSLARAGVERLLLREVSVQLQDDEILLTGSVSTWHEKQLAQESVRVADTGHRIRNQLTVG